MIIHRACPSDVSDAERESVVPHLCLLPEDAGRRVYGLRDAFDALRWLARRLACDCERLGETSEGLHRVAFSMLRPHRDAPLCKWSS